MKRTLLGVVSLFVVMTLSLSAQDFKGMPTIPGQDESKLKNSIVGAYPRQVDWFNWTGAAWSPFQVDRITYNNFGDPLTVTTDVVAGLDTKTTYEYNALQLPTLILVQQSSGAAWVNFERSRAEYDVHGNPTLEVFEKWEGGNWVLDGGMKFEYQMDGARPQKVTISNYDPETGLYAVVSRSTYSYHLSGLVATVMTEIMMEGTLVNSSRISYTWRSAEELQTMLMEAWEEDAWVITGKYDYTYGANDSYTAVFSMFDPESAQYVAFMKDVSEYDSHGNLTLQTSEMWTGFNWMMLSGSQFDITYQGNEPTQKITKEWSGAAYENTTKEVFSDFMSLGLQVLTAENLNFVVYPNPTSDQLTVNMVNRPVDTRVRVDLLDLQGRVISSVEMPAMTHSLSLDLSSVQKGQYIVQVSTSAGDRMQKPVIKK